MIKKNMYMFIFVFRSSNEKKNKNKQILHDHDNKTKKGLVMCFQQCTLYEWCYNFSKTNKKT